MKKLLFFLFILPVFLKAQAVADSTTIPANSKTAIIVHSDVAGTDGFYVDFGGPTSEKRILKNTSGTTMYFKSSFEALIYMESKSFEFAGTFNNMVIDGRASQVILIKRKDMH